MNDEAGQGYVLALSRATRSGSTVMLSPRQRFDECQQRRSKIDSLDATKLVITLRVASCQLMRVRGLQKQGGAAP
ncbi:hypothetical protein [Cupriavidus necator]